MTVYAIVGGKGGVGKTTTAVNLVSEFARYGRRTIFVDGDPQGDGTKHVWQAMEDEIRVQNPMQLALTFNTLLTEETALVADVLYQSKYGFDVMPANDALNATDSSITAPQVRHLLVDIVRELKEMYDDIFFDTRRAGSRLTQSILRVAEKVLIVMQAETLAMEDTEATIKEIEDMKKLNPSLEVVGILATMTQQTVVSKGVVGEVYDFIVKLEKSMNLAPGLYSGKVLPIHIKRTTLHSQASGARLPIRIYIENLYAGKKETERRLKDRQRDTENAVSGYAQLAEMLLLNVPPELYTPGREEQRAAFLQRVS